MKEYEEDDIHSCGGIMKRTRQSSCSCHINPPCSACVDAPLVCDKCEWIYEEEYENLTVTPYRQKSYAYEYNYKLDDTKIDWHQEGHSSFKICTGVYPKGTTSQEVFKAVGGDRGDSFSYFGDGKFKITVFTD